MNARIPFFIFALGLTLGAATSRPAFADDAANRPPVVVTLMAWDELAPEFPLVLNCVSAGKRAELRIPWRDRSLPFEYTGPGRVTISREQTRDGLSTDVPVAEVDIPSGASRVLLVLTRNPRRAETGELPYRAAVINDGYDVFPGQSVRFVNFSGLTLGGTLGGKLFEIAPGRDQVVKADLPERNSLLPFKLARRDSAGNWVKLRSTGLPMGERLRVLVFVTDDALRPGRPALVLVRDHEIPAAMAPATKS